MSWDQRDFKLMRILKHDTYGLLLILCLLFSACGSESPVQVVEEPENPQPPEQQEGSLPTALADTVVDPTVHFQTHEGFGTSLAWFGNVIGGWPSENRNKIAELLFNVENGLGLNVVRYNIGGGENPNHDHMRVGGELEGFQPQENIWDWNVDTNQRWMLAAAKLHSGEDFIAEAFSNSPPYWMTQSQCAAGNEPGSANALLNNRYADFADYLTEVVKHFRDQWGIEFRTLEPVNEPEADWWRAYNGQEGAHFDAAAQANIINALAQSIAQKGLNTQVSAMDAAGIDAAITNYQAYDDQAKSSLSQLNAHGYHGTAENQNDLRNLAKRENKRLWMSESDGGGEADPFGGSTHNPESMGPGLDLAKRIYEILRELQPSSWVFWQAIENWPSQVETNKNWGLLLADFTSTGSRSSDFRTTKKYFVMSQYSKHIRPGAKMVYIDDRSAVAFLSESESKLVIVKANPAGSTSNYSIDLSRFNTQGESVQVFTTSPQHNHQQLEDLAVHNSVLSTTLAANSVTTFVLDGMSYDQGLPIRGAFAIVNRNSKKCLRVPDSAVSGSTILQGDCSSDSQDTWNIIYLGKGKYTIEHQKSGMHADIQGASMEAGAKNILWNAGEGGNQKWHILDQGDGFFHIMNAQSRFLLDISGADQASGAASLQWYENGGSNQDWRFEERLP